MSLGFQARAQQRVLARMGQDSLLRGAPAGKVHIAHHVQLYPGIIDTADDNPMVRYTVATVSNGFAPKIGDLLEHPDGRFTLDRLVTNNGYNSRFIVAVVP